MGWIWNTLTNTVLGISMRVSWGSIHWEEKPFPKRGQHLPKASKIKKPKEQAMLFTCQPLIFAVRAPTPLLFLPSYLLPSEVAEAASSAFHSELKNIGSPRIPKPSKSDWDCWGTQSLELINYWSSQYSIGWLKDSWANRILEYPDSNGSTESPKARWAYITVLPCTK